MDCELFSFFKKYKKKITLILCGHGLWAIISWLFDNILYPAALAWIGYLWGGIIMTSLSCIICAGILIWFEKKREDWVGAGALEELRRSDTTERNVFVRMLAWALRKGDIFMFFLLTIFKDPFITAAYFTRGKFKGLNKKIWLIFGTSTLVANLYWIVRWGIIIEVIRGIFRHNIVH